MNLRFKPTAKIDQFFHTNVAVNEIVCSCYLTPFMFMYVVLPIDMYIYIHIERITPI